MVGHKERRDAALFTDGWASDLSGLLLLGWPKLRYAGARTIDGAPGLLITAPRNAAARYEAPLNTFLALTPEGLAAFAQDDLIGYARFNASVRWLGTYCLQFDVDLAGGSQQGARTRVVSLDPVFIPSHGAAPTPPAMSPLVPEEDVLPEIGRPRGTGMAGGGADETSGNAI
ncbi:hypothetical protein [Robbsia sp. KACC 23696]|uniref:hypothetical protein n=1 Tax=Robbsia sp. KACC 23696 TaxID=3149231 RepID=UPI00325BDCEB